MFAVPFLKFSFSIRFIYLYLFRIVVSIRFIWIADVFSTRYDIRALRQAAQAIQCIFIFI